VTVVDLHPEELLDREARGELAEDDRRRLTDHLARCAACRFARSVRADFAEELAGPSTATPRLGPEINIVVRSRPTRRTAARAMWLLVAAFMLAVTAASASVVPAWRAVIATALRAAGVLPAVPEARAVPTPSQAMPRPSSGVGVGVAGAAPMAGMPAAAPSEAPAEGPVAPPSEAREAPVGQVEPSPAVLTPASLFDRATAARRQGDYSMALELGHDLQSRFPRSREAQEARATMGRLLLDRGNASAALDSLETYLDAGGGGLREEAMAGRAEALERLGRPDAARQAWQALLDAFPLTSYSEHARARLSDPSVP